MKNSLASLYGRDVRKCVPACPEIRWPLPEQLVGVEVEVDIIDHKYHPTQLMPYWRIDPSEHSLIRGAEYVLAMPLRGSDLSKAIYQFFHETQLKRAATGSSHIHLDMLEENVNINTVQNLVLLTYILEPAIFKLADPSREWCGYTNKLMTAPDHLIGTILNKDADEYILPVFTADKSFQLNRYYGLNLMALTKHNTVEFRYFPTPESPEELIGWVRLVQSLKAAALAFTDMASIQAIIESRSQYEGFLSQYFGEWSGVFLEEVPHKAAVAGLHNAMATAAAYAHNIGQKKAVMLDTKALLENKAAGKFIKPKKKVVEQEITYPNPVLVPVGNGAPSTRGLQVGTILVYEGRVHIFEDSGVGWVRLMHSEIRDGSPERILLWKGFQKALLDRQETVAQMARDLRYPANLQRTLTAEWMGCITWVATNLGSPREPGPIAINEVMPTLKGAPKRPTLAELNVSTTASGAVPSPWVQQAQAREFNEPETVPVPAMNRPSMDEVVQAAQERNRQRLREMQNTLNTTATNRVRFIANPFDTTGENQ